MYAAIADGGGGGIGRLGLPETDLGRPGGGGTDEGDSELPVPSYIRESGDFCEGDGWGDGEGV